MKIFQTMSQGLLASAFGIAAVFTGSGVGVKAVWGRGLLMVVWIAGSVDHRLKGRRSGMRRAASQDFEQYPA